MHHTHVKESSPKTSVQLVFTTYILSIFDTRDLLIVGSSSVLKCLHQIWTNRPKRLFRKLAPHIFKCWLMQFAPQIFFMLAQTVMSKKKLTNYK